MLKESSQVLGLVESLGELLQQSKASVTLWRRVLYCPALTERVMITKIALLVIAIVTAAGGIFLAMYANADDAPGGVLMGMVVVISAVILSMVALKRPGGSRQHD
jgi:hypothetical protein